MIVKGMRFNGFLGSGLWDMNQGIDVDAKRGIVAGGRAGSVRVVEYATGRILHEFTTTTTPALAGQFIHGVALRYPYLAVFHNPSLSYAMTLINLETLTAEAYNDGRNNGARMGRWSLDGKRIYYPSIQGGGARAVAFPFTGDRAVRYSTQGYFEFAEVAGDNQGNEWVTYSRDHGGGGPGSSWVTILKNPSLIDLTQQNETNIQTDDRQENGIPKLSNGLYDIIQAIFDPVTMLCVGRTGGFYESNEGAGARSGAFYLWKVAEGKGPTSRIIQPARVFPESLTNVRQQTYFFNPPHWVVFPTYSVSLFAGGLNPPQVVFNEPLRPKPSGMAIGAARDRADDEGGMVYAITSRELSGEVWVVSVTEFYAGGRMILGARNPQLKGPEPRKDGTRNRTLIL